MTEKKEKIEKLCYAFSEVELLFREMQLNEKFRSSGKYRMIQNLLHQALDYSFRRMDYKLILNNIDDSEFNKHYETACDFFKIFLDKFGIDSNFLFSVDLNDTSITQNDLSDIYKWLPNLENSQKTNTDANLKLYSMAGAGCAVAALLNVAKLHNPDSSFFYMARKAINDSNFASGGLVKWTEFIQDCGVDLLCYNTRGGGADGLLPSTFSLDDLKKVLSTEGAYVILNVPYSEIGKYGHFLTLLDIEESGDTTNYIFMPSSNNDTNEGNDRYTGEVSWTLLPQNRVSIPSSTLGTIEQFREHLRVFIPTETTLENILANTLETIEITPTDVIELGAWEYLGNGIFKVKSGAMSWELTQYLVDGKTFGNAQYIMKLVMQTEEGMLLFEDRGNKDFGNINPGEIVVFDENDVSMQSIANALEEVQVQTDEPVIISEQNTQEVVVNAESVTSPYSGIFETWKDEISTLTIQPDQVPSTYSMQGHGWVETYVAGNVNSYTDLTLPNTDYLFSETGCAITLLANIIGRSPADLAQNTPLSAIDEVTAVVEEEIMNASSIENADFDCFTSDGDIIWEPRLEGSDSIYIESSSTAPLTVETYKKYVNKAGEYFIGVKLLLKKTTGETTTHYVGVNGVQNINNEQYFEISPTSDNDYTVGVGTYRWDWILNSTGKIYAPIKSCTGYVIIKKQGE